MARKTHIQVSEATVQWNNRNKRETDERNEKKKGTHLLRYNSSTF